jgi:hypothetical protein
MTVNAVDTPRLSIGPWSFTASPEGNLVVSNGKQSLTFTAQGILNVDNKRVIRDQDPVKIQSATKNAWLDWTQKIKGNGATKYSGVAYWTTDRGDADTQLKIYSG